MLKVREERFWFVTSWLWQGFAKVTTLRGQISPATLFDLPTHALEFKRKQLKSLIAPNKLHSKLKTFRNLEKFYDEFKPILTVDVASTRDIKIRERERKFMTMGSPR